MSRHEHDVRLHRIAEKDLADIVDYIAAERPAAAASTLARIEQSLALLRKSPYLGKLPDDKRLIELGYRCLIVDDYLVFYTVDDRTVLVHRLMRGARD